MIFSAGANRYQFRNRHAFLFKYLRKPKTTSEWFNHVNIEANGNFLGTDGHLAKHDSAFFQTLIIT
jgi:hypothetical protein